MKPRDIDVEIPYKGRTMTLKEWADFLGLDVDVLRMRYRRGAIGWKLFAPIEKGKYKLRVVLRELI
jgi:hypothetical protein